MFASKDLFFTKGAAGAYTISRSVRLRLSATANFQRTYASAPTTRTKQTISMWVKRGGSFGTSQGLFAGYNGTSSNSNQITFDANNNLRFDFGGSAANSLITTQVFRDPSSWYHIVVAVDTTQATAANRVLVYVNGSQVTAFSTATYPGLNDNTQWTLANANNRVGSTWDNGLPLNGYITEVNQIDGQALTPSSFGEINANGVWSPKAYTGTYGTNGFYINFSDNSNNTAATIGKDYSGNANNWTPNNISVTTGATYDSMLDVPTPYADGGNGRGNYCTMNPLSGDYGTFTLSSANLTFAGARTATATAYARSTTGVSSGKWYWEVSPTDVGAGPNLIVGIQDASTTALTAGADIVLNGYGYNASSGFKNNNTTQSAYGASYAAGDVIGIALDLDAGTIVFYKNNTSQGTAFTGITGTYCPVIVMNTGGTARTVAGSINFGQRPFTYTPPSGYVALNTQNLPTPTIANGASYMAASTYTGTGATASISNTVNGVGFQPDLVWFKVRNTTYSHTLLDALRNSGANALFTDTTSAESANYANGQITAFNANGVTINSGVAINESTRPYVAWQWTGGNSTSTNTSGSITSSVRANATAGFSVVTFTAQTSGTATVGHGLGVAPSMIITKVRNNTSGWTTYHSSTGNTAYLVLNTTAASTTLSTAWNNTSPTSNVFTLGSAFAAASQTMVAYCFAAVAGYSAFGSYTGNGSTDGPFVYLGFRPRFVMFKRTDVAANWLILDTSRNTYNVVDLMLEPNLSDAEATGLAGTNNWDALSNGFKVRGTGALTNASSGTYIYAAFAENPFKYSLAR